MNRFFITIKKSVTIGVIRNFSLKKIINIKKIKNIKEKEFNIK